ncbi:hypothetical protein SAMN04489716_6903 [Actinoplanes derwentensis]|uniref:3'-phosphoadenosine 5'-phosphosulfate sulfotransferase (PAPS reductase)/FAD synthetase n=2 Tax=Actinoplanes derwentensis TaxID=113562 RepID=A0A1H2CVY5_9ACTN|nr:hypothetical protein SAMN04489716_6903 [Actinoplanes derwentensis]
MSMGMGVDSAALLLRWLLDPRSRDFDLSDLTVLTAMTGDEYTATRMLMEKYLLPVMAQHAVRYVMLARAGQSETAGYEVLSDSHSTSRMIMHGTRWRLSDEQTAAGVVPQQVRHRRFCSYRAKGQVLDWWIADALGGAAYRHVVGFAAEEVRRSSKDTSYTSAARNPWYPLIEWGWDRQSCLAYLQDAFGVTWSRSCCGYCPFQAGPELDLLCQRWRNEPDRAEQALRLEYTAVAINPRSLLFGKKRSARQVAILAGLRDLVEHVDADLAAQPWAIYDVRRAYPARRLDKTKPSGLENRDSYAKGQGARSLEPVCVGTYDSTRATVLAMGGQPEGEHQIVRAWTHRAGPPYPSREAFLVAAPAGVPTKVGPAFPAVWAQAEDTPVAQFRDPWTSHLPLALAA